MVNHAFFKSLFTHSIKIIICVGLMFDSMTALSAKLQSTPGDRSSRQTNRIQSADKDLLMRARLAYEKNELEEAIQNYSRIPVTSDFWLEALEERAWAYTRQENYTKALADLKSVTHPVWQTQVGPESMMLSAFVSLKLCAFKDVLEKIDLFKSRNLTRVTALEKLQQQPLPEELLKLLRQAKNSQLTLMALGKTSEHYPRYFFRDLELLEAARQNSPVRIKQRVLDLIDRDLAEIRTNLTKMKVIEIEVIQRVSTKTRDTQTKKNLSFSRYDKTQQVSFPLSDDEVWLDEMGSFEVKTQNCENWN